MDSLTNIPLNSNSTKSSKGPTSANEIFFSSPTSKVFHWQPHDGLIGFKNNEDILLMKYDQILDLKLEALTKFINKLYEFNKPDRK